ncbi:hypothetical protein B0H14DRAFT_3711172 [Mycena olivaceomarginata]|nr:hypothetical protein B0H14DRAFT_3711172 [Mycena olivaceomarginata]
MATPIKWLAALSLPSISHPFALPPRPPPRRIPPWLGIKLPGFKSTQEPQMSSRINQLEIDETIPKRANYIPMYSKVTAVAIFYCWTGNPNDGHKGQRRRGRKSKWAGAAGVGRPGRDRWRQRAADASRQTLSRKVDRAWQMAAKLGSLCRSGA